MGASRDKKEKDRCAAKFSQHNYEGILARADSHYG